MPSSLPLVVHARCFRLLSSILDDFLSVLSNVYLKIPFLCFKDGLESYRKVQVEDLLQFDSSVLLDIINDLGANSEL